MTLHTEEIDKIKRKESFDKYQKLELGELRSLYNGRLKMLDEFDSRAVYREMPTNKEGLIRALVEIDLAVDSMSEARYGHSKLLIKEIAGE
ncbi:hypothetical protein J4466_05530 [Candidatus Pacearchaeota archaeon]|nr:hypothetical protein [Candidatus Pacearchaeota archaeon]